MVGGLTLKADKLANAVASGRYDTQRAAAKSVGLTEQHASVILKDPKMQRAIAAKQDARADRAARIASRSSEVVLAALDSVRCSECGQDRSDPMFALAAWKTSTEVAANEPPTDQGLTASESAEGRALVLQAAMLGARLCARVGKDEAVRLLSSRLDVLPERILKRNTIRKLADLAAGE